MRTSAFVLLLVAGLASAAMDDTDGTCVAHVSSACNDLGGDWSFSPLCSSIHGGFRGNAQNLHKLMTNHFRDSFKLLSLASQFNTDKINRLGFHKFFQDYSDKMWENGKKILKYIVQRGGRVSSSLEGFKITDANIYGSHGEVGSLAATLDMFKQNAEDVHKVCESAQHRKKHSDESVGIETFDPAISHFLKENLVEDYTDSIRHVSGHLNVLSSILRNDKSADMGLILYDQALRN